MTSGVLPSRTGAWLLFSMDNVATCMLYSYSANSGVLQGNKDPSKRGRDFMVLTLINYHTILQPCKDEESTRTPMWWYPQVDNLVQILANNIPTPV